MYTNQVPTEQENCWAPKLYPPLEEQRKLLPLQTTKPTALYNHSTDNATQPKISSIGTSDTVMSHTLFLLFVGGSTEELKKMLDVNVLGLSVCTIQAVQSMKEREVDDGHIIHINRLDSL